MATPQHVHDQHDQHDQHDEHDEDTQHDQQGRLLRSIAPRRVARHARPAPLPRAVGLLTLATATGLALLPADAAAEPRPSADQVAERVAQLDTQASLAVEEFRQAEQEVEEVSRRADAARQRVAAEQARLEQVRSQMASVVAAAYRRGGDDRFVALVVDGDPQAFLDRASALDRLARRQADVLAEIETARARAGAEQAAAQRQLAALEAAQQQLAARRAQVERTLQAQQALLAGLQEQERRRVEALRTAAAPTPRASRDDRAATDRKSVV